MRLPLQFHDWAAFFVASRTVKRATRSQLLGVVCGWVEGGEAEEFSSIHFFTSNRHNTVTMRVQINSAGPEEEAACTSAPHAHADSLLKRARNTLKNQPQHSLKCLMPSVLLPQGSAPLESGPHVITQTKRRANKCLAIFQLIPHQEEQLAVWPVLAGVVPRLRCHAHLQNLKKAHKKPECLRKRLPEA